MKPETFKLLRQYHKLTQAELGSQIDRTACAVCNIERGRNGIKERLLEKLAEAYSLTKFDLMLIDEALAKQTHQEALHIVEGDADLEKLVTWARYSLTH